MPDIQQLVDAVTTVVLVASPTQFKLIFMNYFTKQSAPVSVHAVAQQLVGGVYREQPNGTRR